MTVAGDDARVLVVGAGPVGLTAAHELARRGIAVRLVDRAPGPATTSRATATHARTLEIYEQMGLLADLLPRGQRAENFSIHMRGRVLIRFGTDYSALPTRFPFTLQVDQVITEEVLRERVRRLGVDIEWGVTLESLRQQGNRVYPALRHSDGREETAQAGWLVGADGAHSTVRSRLGLRLVGDSLETWLVADAIVDADLPRDSLHWVHTGTGTVLLVPFPEEGKWRLLDTEDTGSAEDPDAVARRFSEKIGRALRRPVHVHRPSWLSVFTIQQRMIQQMRVGRCFVAGDAAHVHSPASGQGMNTGIQDAYNLAWKLADVIHGNAAEELLDTYGEERVPIGETLLHSTKTATALIALRNAAAPVVMPLGLGIVDAIKPLKRKIEQKMMRTMSGLALNYRESSLSLRAPEVPGGFAPGDRISCGDGTVRDHLGWQRLVSELTEPGWLVLLFAETARDVAEEVNLRFRGVTAHVVGSSELVDPTGRVRADFTASEDSFAVIRPDGYLAARGTLGDLPAVLRRLHLLPVPMPADAVTAEEIR
ncbi:FAD-dependent monooxygenase [Kutzneria viridogrisea]|uniref:NADPH-dependent dioxygenase n=1 Tax=Kutzneria viridogrisea TaxID=47990 RepID=A0ABR6BB92_9PSEU|nr:NADPH-dependent dioxygenase [Kutzneria viridogrisea]